MEFQGEKKCLDLFTSTVGIRSIEKNYRGVRTWSCVVTGSPRTIHSVRYTILSAETILFSKREAHARITQPPKHWVQTSIVMSGRTQKNVQKLSTTNKLQFSPGLAGDYRSTRVLRRSLTRYSAMQDNVQANSVCKLISSEVSRRDNAGAPTPESYMTPNTPVHYSAMTTTQHSTNKGNRVVLTAAGAAAVNFRVVRKGVGRIWQAHTRG